MTRVVGLDISLASTGFADLQIIGAGGLGWGYLLNSRSIDTDPAGTILLDVHRRMTDISDRITRLIYDTAPLPALVVVEGPSMGSISGAHNISGNWWRIVDRLLSNGLVVVEVSPPSLKLYATGSGATHGKTKVTKQMVINAVNERYDVSDIQLRAKDTDQADAIVLAAIGARLMGHPIDPHIPAPNLRALTKIRLPEGLSSGAAT